MLKKSILSFILMKDLTILIPTRLKKEKLPIIEFIISQFEDTKILFICNKKINSKFKNTNFLITSKKHLTDKIIYGLQKVKTKNILLLPDDEFPIVNSIQDIYSNFKKDTNISSGIGIKFYFDYRNPKIFFPINHHSFKFYNLKNKESKKIENSIKFYAECFWSFHRTDLLKKFFNFYKKNKTYNSKFFLEYNMMLFMKIFGNVRYYQLPWSLKTKEFRDWPELQNFCTLKNFKIKFKKEFNFLTKSYYNHNKIKSNSKKIISKFYRAFEKRYTTQRPQDKLKNLNLLEKIIFILKKMFYKLIIHKPNLTPQLVDMYFIKYFNKKEFKGLFKKKYLKKYSQIISLIENKKLLPIFR